jgi:glycosyltransferase involved in cell wall biosynthesis
MFMPFISVIIPSFNRAWCIERAVNSVLSQSFKDFELIFVDDGSTDDTKNIVKEYKDIRYYYIENSGVSHARNFGIKKAKGHLISFLDSDDMWHENKLLEQVELYKKKPYRLCHTNEQWIRGGKKVNQMKKHKKSGGDIFVNSLALCLISPSSVVLEKTIFNEIGFFDESLKVCEDYDLWLRILSKYRVSFIDKVLITKYGGHMDQLSNASWGNDIYRVKSLINLIKNNNLSEEKLRLTKEKLMEKTLILYKGFKKREKTKDANYYLNIYEKIKGELF